MTEINDATHDQIEIVDLNVEMQRSYLNYAMSVIVSRALPDVRDGLKPVHRRVIYAMYDGGYRPDRAFNKSARVVGEVMGQYHPHGDSAIYDTLVRLTQSWSLRYPLVQGQGNFGSPGNDSAAAARYTECRMASLAMEMVRDIDQDTVDFVPNYDGKNLEPTVLPSRFPNLLVNGSSGIAVGMATNIPPHNLTEVAAGVQWALEHPDATREELLEALMERITGPDFPTGGQIVGRRGIQDAYRTGRGSVTMRAITEITEDKRGRTIIAITQLPYQVNPDNLLERIAELVEQGKVGGIADLVDESSSRTGMRIVVVLKRDAVPKVVLNNLFKYTQLQDNFGANMLALVDGVPRTLTLDAFVSNWIEHQVEVIQRRTAYRLRIAEERVHILIGLLKAIDRIDEVIALIRASESASVAQAGLMKLLDIDEIQAQAILDMQLRKLAALERNELQTQHDKLMAEIADYKDILSNLTRQRSIVSEELAEIVNKFGDERRSTIVADENDVTHEDLIAVEPIVVTLSADGYIKRTKAALYRSQKRGGRGVKGAALKQDDVVTNFFVTTTHHWILFFTNRGRVFRVKAYELTDTGRDARGQHVANLLSLAPEEQVVEVQDLQDYSQAKYLVLATRNGVIKILVKERNFPVYITVGNHDIQSSHPLENCTLGTLIDAGLLIKTDFVSDLNIAFAHFHNDLDNEIRNGYLTTNSALIWSCHASISDVPGRQEEHMIVFENIPLHPNNVMVISGHIHKPMECVRSDKKIFINFVLQYFIFDFHVLFKILVSMYLYQFGLFFSIIICLYKTLPKGCKASP